MKAVDIERMKELDAKATPGPWKLEGESWNAGIRFFSFNREDADFIAAAREFVPWAIAEIERLNQKLLEVGQLLLEALWWFEYDGKPESLPEVDTPVIRFAPPGPKHGDRKKFECCYGADLEIGDQWAYFPSPSAGGIMPTMRVQEMKSEIIREPDLFKWDDCAVCAKKQLIKSYFAGCMAGLQSQLEERHAQILRLEERLKNLQSELAQARAAAAQGV